MIVRYMPADPAGNLTAIVLSPVAPQARAAVAHRNGRGGQVGRGKENRTVKGKNRQTENFCEAVYCCRSLSARQMLHKTRARDARPYGGGELIA